MVDQRKSKNLPPKTEWETPIKVFRAIERFTYINFHPPFAENFELDPCTTDENNLKLPHFYTKKDDVLKQKWAPYSTFVNCPYDDIPTWIRKAIDEAHHGTKVCMLLPAATSEYWFHDLATQGHITLLRGRTTFKNAPSSPRFGSILVHYFQNQLAPDQLCRGIDVGVL